MTEKVIIDSDWNGSELPLLSVLLVHAHRYKIMGLTTVFGNIPHDRAVENAGKMLHFLDANHIPYHKGAVAPLNGSRLVGNSQEGMSNARLYESPMLPEEKQSTDFILDTLASEPAETVTLFAAGPLTNIAKAIEKGPEVMARIKSIYMTASGFYMAPDDAQTVLESGLPVHYLSDDCKKDTVYDPRHQRKIQMAFMEHPEQGSTIDTLIRTSELTDQENGRTAPVVYDAHMALAALYPKYYASHQGTVSIKTVGKERGQADITPSDHGSVTVYNRIRNPDKLFKIVLDSFQFNLIQEVKDENVTPINGYVTQNAPRKLVR